MKIFLFSFVCYAKTPTFVVLKFIERMEFNFKTILEFNDYFKDEKTCYEFLEKTLWDNVPVCPHCGVVKKPYKVKARGKFQDIPSYRCSDRDCDLPFTVRTGSVFEGSKVELRKWLQAVYELSISNKGISSIELGKRIGVSQKTAWFINHRLRVMLTETLPHKLEGTIEIDETFVGGKNKNRHIGKKVADASDKTPVLGLVQRGGNLKTFVIPDREKETILPIMLANTEPKTNVITDGYTAYNDLSLTHYHTSVKHGEGDYKYITVGLDHTNNIEGVWSILKRGILGTFHSVSRQHLQKYCNEFTFRYNHRKVTPIDRFYRGIKNSRQERIRYKALTSSKQINKNPALETQG